MRQVCGMLVLILGMTAAASASAADATKIHCEALDQGASVSSFDFFLTLTGHPMGGIFSFSGMFNAEGEALPCKPTSGYLKTTSNHPRGTVTYTATSSCLSNFTYTLRVETKFYNQNEKYPSLLKVVEHGPLGDFPADETKMTCELEH